MPILEMNCHICNVLYVGGIFPSRTTKFCSRSCMAKSFEKKQLRNCLTCKKEFHIVVSQSKGKFCSIKCIRFTGNKNSLGKTKGTGFWDIATQLDKNNKIKEIFNKLVIKSEKCWSWKNKSLSNGYVVIHIGRKKTILGHRASWIIHNGEIKDNLFVLHKCDNPSCTNPEHLFLGTQKDNTADMFNKNRQNPSRGINHYNVKLSTEDVMEIKRLLKINYSQSKLGKMFKVSPSTIQNIADNKAWKHI